MMTNDEPDYPESTYSEREKVALESLVEPRALSESRIAATLRRAKREKSFLVRHPGMIRAAAALMLLASLSAGFWHWSGINSDRDLSFAQGIEVLTDAESYDFERRRAVLGKVYRVLTHLIAELEDAGEMTPALRDRVLVGLARPPRAGLYHGPFEQVVAKIGVQPLTKADRDELVRAMIAGADAARALRAVDPGHDSTVRIFEQRLRKRMKSKPPQKEHSDKESGLQP